MTFGSLFAGIGGIDLGLERAGMICKWQVEIDDYCRKVLAKHWPNVRRYEDVTTFMNPDRPDIEQADDVDLICGGFPCQDISNAGKRAGIEGERSGLWSEFARVIRVLRPRYVLVENVAALLGRGIERVVGDLAQCWYDAEWDCLPAAAFGAVHIRNRVFLLAYANEHSKPDLSVNGQERKRMPSDDCGEVSDANRSRVEERQGKRGNSRQKQPPALNEVVTRMLTTPSADDTGHRKKPYSQGGEALSYQAGGQLNPSWVEWLMGFPIGWTDLEDSATPLSRK